MGEDIRAATCDAQPLPSLIRTVPSAQESNLLGSCEFVGFTTGMEFHHSPKINFVIQF